LHNSFSAKTESVQMNPKSIMIQAVKCGLRRKVKGYWLLKEQEQALPFGCMTLCMFT